MVMPDLEKSMIVPSWHGERWADYCIGGVQARVGKESGILRFLIPGLTPVSPCLTRNQDPESFT